MQLCYLGLLMSLLAAGPGAAAGADSGDIKSRPPLVREFVSASGRFRLEVRGTPQWRSPQVVATLTDRHSGKGRLVWSKPLPQRLGPRAAIVLNDGSSALFDEWIRTPSSYALMIIARDGELVRQYSISEIAAVAGVPVERLVRQAKLGAWMAGQPRVAADGVTIIVPVTPAPLLINFRQGEISRSK